MLVGTIVLELLIDLLRTNLRAVMVQLAPGLRISDLGSRPLRLEEAESPGDRTVPPEIAPAAIRTTAISGSTIDSPLVSPCHA